MIAQIITENGQKKIKPLTADTGAGNPVGTIIPMYKKSSPSGYLYCDGSTFDETLYPLLYAYLGTNVLPDLREVGLKGAEKNTTYIFDSTETDPRTGQAGTQNHDVFTQGEFKDDQLQNHTHGLQINYPLGNGAYSGTTGWTVTNQGSVGDCGIILGTATQANNGRKGDVTRGKSLAVYWYIKATSGLSENAQDNVLNTINENLSYSTTEHKTGKKWIDGKDIWSKTVIFGVLPNASQKAFAHNIANVSEITKQEGYFTNEITFFPLPYVDNGLTQVQMFTDKTYIRITTYTDLSTFSATVTLEYTKTT